MPNDEAEPSARAQEIIKAFAHEAVVLLWSSCRVLNKTIHCEHARFQGIVNAFAVHGVYESGGIANCHPPRARTFHTTHGQAPCAWLFYVFAKCPRLTNERCILIEQCIEVEFLETLHGAESTHTNVHCSITRREHPPVPRHCGSMFILQTERRFQITLGVSRGLRICPNG